MKYILSIICLFLCASMVHSTPIQKYYIPPKYHHVNVVTPKGVYVKVHREPGYYEIRIWNGRSFQTIKVKK